eukprot:3480300-Lingulodinium_polyedra.AAC.2
MPRDGMPSVSSHSEGSTDTSGPGSSRQPESVTSPKRTSRSQTRSHSASARPWANVCASPAI